MANAGTECINRDVEDISKNTQESVKKKPHNNLTPPFNLEYIDMLNGKR